MTNEFAVAIIGLLMISMRIIEALVKKFGNNRSLLKQDERSWLKKLYDMHNVLDEDGKPIWYVPKKIDETTSSMLALLDKMNDIQERQTLILEKIADGTRTILVKMNDK